MRERLIAAFVGLTILGITAFGVVLAYRMADSIRAQETRKVERSVVLLGVIAEDRARAGLPITQRFLGDLLNVGEHIEYVAADGARVEALAADHGEQPHDGDDLVARQGTSDGATVTLSRSGEIVNQRVSDALTPLVVLGILLVGLAAVAGWLAARALSRPFRDLAAVATEIGKGRFDVEIAHSPVPEAEAIGQALRQSAAELGLAAAREREFNAHASHELRTPITAMRLELEDLILWPETTPEVAEQLTRSLTQLGRLSETVTRLLDDARDHRHDRVTIDVAALARDTVERWRPRARRRSIVLDGATPVGVQLPHGPIGRILDALLDNAIEHGSGTISVEVTHQEKYVEVQVADQGARTFGDEVLRNRVYDGSPKGRAVGVAAAAELAESLGGHLRLRDVPETTFSLLLPAPTHDRLGA